MGEKHFRELVSLYCDGEISRRELDRLRREVQRRSGRRHEFRRLMRLHAAAVRVAGREVADLRQVEERVLLFPPSRRVFSGSLVGTGLAMAASLALLLAVVSTERGIDGGQEVALLDGAQSAERSEWLPTVVWEVRLAGPESETPSLLQIAANDSAESVINDDQLNRRIDPLPPLYPREPSHFQGRVHLAGGSVDWRGLSSWR